MSALPRTAEVPLQINQGLWLGLLGIVIFSATLPLTKLAVGPLDAPQLSQIGRAHV